MTDPEGGALVFHIIGGIHYDRFAIDSSAAILSLTADYEVDASQLPATAEVIIRATDDAMLSSTATVLVTFSDVNKAPSILNLPRDVTVAEDIAPGTTVFVLDLSDPDTGDVVTPLFTVVEGDVSTKFDIDNTSKRKFNNSVFIQ